MSRWTGNVGCITCGGERNYPKYGTPTVAAAICRHPAARPESCYVWICIDQRSQPLAGAGVAMNHRRYIACTVVQSGCSGGNLPPTGPEGRNRGTFGFVTIKPETSVIPSERSESRNLLKWQVLSCVGTISNVVDSSTPLALRSE